MIANRQNRVRLNLAMTRHFVRRLRSALNLNGESFDVSFVDDLEIERLNATYRGQRKPTDVLSFPVEESGNSAPRPPHLERFLGDVIISAETARRNAREAGHSVQHEIFWVILHGALHLLGHNHETDRGEMTSLELSLREQLRIGRSQEPIGNRSAKANRQ